MALLKLVLFCGVCVYAAAVDIRRRIVPTRIHVLLFLIGLLQIGTAALFGCAAVFLPLFIVGVITNGMGGGDIKFAGMCGFVLQGMGGLLGAAAGLLLALLVVPLSRKLRGAKSAPFPLVPFLSAGFIAVGITHFIIN